MLTTTAGKGLNTWLDLLEPHLCPVGYPTCRGWTWVVLEGDDGQHQPEQCPECGRVAPGTLVVHIKGIAIAAL